jgi:hypothetical protein
LLTPPDFAATPTAVDVARVARAWGQSPSRVLGLPPGSVEAYVVDRDLAARLEDADRAADEGLS